jgi:protein gp37
MAENSKIAWTHHTWSPWVGCTRVSPACDFCYAESWAARSGSPQLWQGERRRTSKTYWHKPANWNRKASRDSLQVRVFPSLCDPFDNQVPDEWRRDFWDVIRYTPYLDWLLLTKRPQNIAKMLPPTWWGEGWPNVWLGTTAEDAKHYQQRWPHLAAVPSAVRFLSYEPALGPIGDLRLAASGAPQWVIVGAESGSHRRPMDSAWPRAVRHQCQRSGVPFFYKQAVEGRKMVSLPELDGRQWAEFPTRP